MQPTPPPLSSYVESWTPGPVTDEDTLAAGPAVAVSALLDLPEADAPPPAFGRQGRTLPPLWQWFYFLRWPAQRDLGADGHSHDGRFLPPIPDRQRMMAGGRCEIAEPLRLDEQAERITSLGPVTAKQGSTGELLFVTERLEFRQRGRVCLVEEQDFVYRSGRATGRYPAAPDDSPAPPADDPWQLTLRPDPALLFRVSALTANTHRIHYDAPYAMREEGYPGLVVHGPLLALLMLELARRDAPERQVRRLSYRLRRPVFAGEHLLVSGTPSASGTRAESRVATRREARHATAEVTFA